MGMVCLASIPLMAQKKMTYTFQYKADSAQQGTLKEVTQINYPNTTSVRLYFEDTQLGNESYLLLEGSDGAQQKMDAQALKNWSYSSAYFNGGKVKVSVYQAVGDSLVTFKLKEIKVDEGPKDNAEETASSARKVTTQSATHSNAAESNPADIPYGAAVGRLTNGNRVGGAGWIAPNGAIVTSRQGYKLISEGFDIIEFNVPLSNKDKSVNHPGPEDQYPLKVDEAVFTSRDVYVKRVYWSVWSPHYLLTHLGFAIVEALPNGTGLRPGERQQEYFRVIKNPNERTVEATDREIDAFSYSGLFDVYPESPYSYNFVLQKRSSTLLKVKDHVQNFTPDTDEILIYNLYGQNVQWDKVDWSHTGGPVTYKNSNIAIGVHEEANWELGPSIGNGFRDDNFRNHLNNFFTSNVVYADAEGLYNDATGSIDKPYIFIQDAADHADDNDVINIARGTYNESLTINTPMTLKAPVGVVKIGAPGGNNSRTAQNTLPAELFAEDDENVIDDFEEKIIEGNSFQSYPNPFTDRTELRYTLSEATSVTVKVYNMLGNEVNTLVQTQQLVGAHTVVWDGRNTMGNPAETGIYIIQLQTGSQTSVVRVIKK